MQATSSNLFFGYGSTARIRIKRQNCLYCDDYPAIYRIKTAKLDFTVPRAAVLIQKEHVYIPNSLYTAALSNYYSNIRL